MLQDDGAPAGGDREVISNYALQRVADVSWYALKQPDRPRSDARSFTEALISNTTVDLNSPSFNECGGPWLRKELGLQLKIAPGSSVAATVGVGVEGISDGKKACSAKEIFLWARAVGPAQLS
jgi:hypothetical protein